MIITHGHSHESSRTPQSVVRSCLYRVMFSRGAFSIYKVSVQIDSTFLATQADWQHGRLFPMVGVTLSCDTGYVCMWLLSPSTLY